MVYYLYDGGDGSLCRYQSIDMAIEHGNQIIDEYRDCCDPVWPEYVETVAIYECDDGDDPMETRKVIAQATQVNRVEIPEDVDGDGYSPSLDLWFDEVDFYVDYKMEMVSDG